MPEDYTPKRAADFPNGSPYMTVEEAAAFLECSPEQLEYNCQDGLIPSFRNPVLLLGRRMLRVEDVEQRPTVAKFVTFQEFSDFTGVPARNFQWLFRRYGRDGKHVPGELIWKLLLAGAEQESGAVEKLSTEYHKARRNVSAREKRLVIERDGKSCRYCGKRVTRNTIQVDHIIPRSRGGTTALDNLALCCRRCNYRKRDHLLEEIGMTLRPSPNGHVQLVCESPINSPNLAPETPADHPSPGGDQEGR